MTINKTVCIWFILLILFSVLPSFNFTSIVSANEWQIEGNKVFVNDSQVFLSAQPHTIIQDTDVVFELISKQFSGDIDVAFGINNTLMHPKNPMIWNGTTWNVLNKEIQTVNYNYQSFNRWYLLKNVNINQNVLYRLKISIDIVFNTSGKYFFGVKRSSDAINQGYYIDPWWNSSWGKYQPLTIESDYIDTGLGNFPLLVVVPISVGSECQSNGEDIRFISTDNTTEFNYEIESWNATRDSYVWVNISETIPSGSDYTFLFYYYNNGASDNQNPTGVWDSGYKIVQHMDGANLAGTDDSTLNYNNAISQSSVPSYQANGKIGYGVGLDGSDFICFGADSSLRPTTVTVEAWFSTSTVAAGAKTLFQMPYTSDSGWNAPYVGYGLLLSGAVPSCHINEDGTYKSLGASSVVVDTWYYMAMTYDGTDHKQYLNTSLIDSDSYSGSITYSGTPFLVTGIKRLNPDIPYEFWNGLVDELRVSSGARNASWINASFHNQNQSTHLGNFLTWGVAMTLGLEITGYSPASGTENISNVNTTLSAIVNHTTGKNMSVNFYSNSSGNWMLFATNTTSGNETCYQTNSNFSGNGTIYYWNVSVEEDINITNSPVYWFRTRYLPLNPTNVDTDYVPSDLNISWVTGKYADTTVLLRNNASIPSSVTDGVVYYNGTLEYFVDDDVTTQAYFRLYSYNSTRNIYSSGVNAEFGGLEVNVYNESDPTTAITDWNLFVSNESGSEVYENLSNNNPHIVNYSSLPLGANIVILVNTTGYRNRIYYIDLSVNAYYILNVFLTPIYNASLYLLSVIDELDRSVSDASVEIKRYLDGSYQNVTTLLTDGNGQVEAYLIPDQIYKVTISKSGYKTEISDYYPNSDIYIHTFRLELETITPPAPYVESEEITFNGYISGTTLYINFTDNLEQTINSQIYLYEVNYSSGITSLFDSDIKTGNSDYQISTTINTSNGYIVILHYNHTTFGYNMHTIYFEGSTTTITTQAVGDTLFNLNYGFCPFGWSNLFMWFFLLGCFFSFGQRGSGISLIFTGGLVIFINSIIGFNTILAVAAGGMIPALFIIVGVMVLWRDAKREATT